MTGPAISPGLRSLLDRAAEPPTPAELLDDADDWIYCLQQTAYEAEDEEFCGEILGSVRALKRILRELRREIEASRAT
jgi:hypothetical protein